MVRDQDEATRNDERREKLPFYAKCKIPEVWLIDPVTRAVEAHVLRKGSYAVVVTREGSVIAPRLGIELRVIDGPKLRVSWAGGTADVWPTQSAWRSGSRYAFIHAVGA
jgi:hypothetical protein